MTAPHDDTSDVATEGAASRNPAGAPTVQLSMPVTMKIRLVDAARLLDYEIWTWVGTGSLSATVGFAVAAVAGEGRDGYWAAAIAMGVVLALAITMAARYRLAMREKTQTVVYPEGFVQDATDEAVTSPKPHR